MNDPSLRGELETAVGEVLYNPAGQPLTPDELLDKLKDVDGMIAGLDYITREVIEGANRLKVIARYGVGLDRVDLDAAREKGVVVTNTPGANATSVAELSVALMLALARNLPYAISQTRSGEWPRLKGTTLSQKTVGLLGLGAIGKRVAHLLRGFDCRVIGYDPALSPGDAADGGIEWAETSEVIAQADFLSLHLPLTPETRNLLDGKALGSMKDGAFLVNTARSELIDEAALMNAVQHGKLAGVALDTFHEEPPPADHPLLKFDQVIVTPHTGAHTDSSTNLMGRIALDECLAVLRGETPQYRIV
jgi:D-3-phosphoglycerate dehydrogenase